MELSYTTPAVVTDTVARICGRPFKDMQAFLADSLPLLQAARRGVDPNGSA
jgi:hypothetical protein